LEGRRGKVLSGLSVSLDRLIADKNDDVSEVFALFSGAWERLYEVAGVPLRGRRGDQRAQKLQWVRNAIFT
jgi:hypothetical protein